VVAELLDGAPFEKRAIGGGLLARYDKSTRAAAIGVVPAFRVVHQGPGGVSTRGSVSSELLSVATTTVFHLRLGQPLAALLGRFVVAVGRHHGSAGRGSGSMSRPVRRWQV